MQSDYFGGVVRRSIKYSCTLNEAKTLKPNDYRMYSSIRSEGYQLYSMTSYSICMKLTTLSSIDHVVVSWKNCT